MKRFPRTAFAITFCLVTAHSATSQQTQQAPAQSSGAKIEAKVNAVLIPVVVRDAQGRAVGTLKKEDFQLFDKNKPKAISGFSIQARIAVAGNSIPAGAAPISPSVAQQVATPPQRFVVFLFDDMHISSGDLMQLQKAASKIVAQSLADSDKSAVVSFSGVNSGMTRDRARLQDAIAKVKVQSLYRPIGRECPNIDYYQADLLENRHDRQAFDAAVEDTVACAHLDHRPLAEKMVRIAARRAVEIGDKDVRATLGFVQDVVRKMATLPGDRTLILLSPGFLTTTPEAMTDKSHVLDLAAQSKVTISALDARGLYTTAFDASERGASTASNSELAIESQYRSNSMSLNQDVMAELADGTGGTFFRNSNDLEGGLQKLVAAPEYVYLLELSLENVKLDGTYHPLKVKVDRDGFNLQARRGYFTPKPEKAKK
jgi:VWFA-related protein